MTDKELVDIAKDNLTRILGFFPRVDTILSVLLAIDIGMLAFLAANMPPLKNFGWTTLIGIISFIFLGKSLFNLYSCAFPRLDGGPLSLIYFREIAARSEDEFQNLFESQTEKQYLEDLLNQIWRNSEILTQKFNNLKLAFISLVFALVPWLIALALFASQNTEYLLVK